MKEMNILFFLYLFIETLCKKIYRAELIFNLPDSINKITADNLEYYKGSSNEYCENNSTSVVCKWIPVNLNDIIKISIAKKNISQNLGGYSRIDGYKLRTFSEMINSGTGNYILTINVPASVSEFKYKNADFDKDQFICFKRTFNINYNSPKSIVLNFSDFSKEQNILVLRNKKYNSYTSLSEGDILTTNGEYKLLIKNTTQIYGTLNRIDTKKEIAYNKEIDDIFEFNYIPNSKISKVYKIDLQFNINSKIKTQYSTLIQNYQNCIITILKCPENCKKCTSLNHCDECEDDYFFIGDDDSQCYSNSYFSSNGYYKEGYRYKRCYESCGKCDNYKKPKEANFSLHFCDSCLETKKDNYKYFIYESFDSKNFINCYTSCKKIGRYAKSKTIFECVPECNKYISGDNSTCYDECEANGEHYNGTLIYQKHCVVDCYESKLFYVNYNGGLKPKCSLRCPYHYSVDSKNKCIRDDNFFNNENYPQSNESNFFIDPVINETIYIKDDENCPDEFPYENRYTFQCINTCTFEDILDENNKCHLTKNENLLLNTTISIHSNFIKNLNDKDCEFYKFFKGRNLTIEVFCTCRKDKIIELNECEETLKKEYNIDKETPLIIIKQNIIDLKGYTTIKYEVYNSINGQFLDVKKYCNNYKITIYHPSPLNDTEYETYCLLKTQGYEQFDITDKFFSDYCTIFISESGTDMTIKDRQNSYYTTNDFLCPIEGEYKETNMTNRKSKCFFIIKNEENKEKNNDEKLDFGLIATNFLNVFKDTNIKIVNCYPTFFSVKGIIKNISFYFISIVIINHLIMMIIIFITYKKKFNIIINEIYLKKTQGIKQINKQSNPPKNEKRVIKIPENRKVKENKNTIIMEENKNKFEFDFSLIQRIKNEVNKEKSFRSSKRLSLIPEVIQPQEIIKKKKSHGIISEYLMNLKKEERCKLFNDEELNTMEYEKALLIDCRAYKEIYLNLVKSKNSITFAFFNNNDYNLKLMKIVLIIFLFTFNIAINSLFFSDETMEKINTDKGKYNFIYQLPSSIYTSIISAVISLIIKFLSITQGQIIALKAIKTKNEFMINQKKVLFRIKIKFIFFFILSTNLLFIVWYYLGCFCSVYQRTQIHLVKSSLISYLISLILPFFINIIPPFIRLCALKNDKHKCLYKITQFLFLL